MQQLHSGGWDSFAGKKFLGKVNFLSNGYALFHDFFSWCLQKITNLPVNNLITIPMYLTAVGWWILMGSFVYSIQLLKAPHKNVRVRHMMTPWPCLNVAILYGRNIRLKPSVGTSYNVEGNKEHLSNWWHKNCRCSSLLISCHSLQIFVTAKKK